MYIVFNRCVCIKKIENILQLKEYILKKKQIFQSCPTRTLFYYSYINVLHILIFCCGYWMNFLVNPRTKRFEEAPKLFFCFWLFIRIPYALILFVHLHEETYFLEGVSMYQIFFLQGLSCSNIISVFNIYPFLSFLSICLKYFDQKMSFILKRHKYMSIFFCYYCFLNISFLFYYFSIASISLIVSFFSYVYSSQFCFYFIFEEFNVTKKLQTSKIKKKRTICVPISQHFCRYSILLQKYPSFNSNMTKNINIYDKMYYPFCIPQHTHMCRVLYVSNTGWP